MNPNALKAKATSRRHMFRQARMITALAPTLLAWVLSATPASALCPECHRDGGDVFHVECNTTTYDPNHWYPTNEHNWTDVTCENIFAGSNCWTNVATLYQAPPFTGGQINKIAWARCHCEKHRWYKLQGHSGAQLPGWYCAYTNYWEGGLTNFNDRAGVWPGAEAPYAGDPFNVVNGSMSFDETDMALPAPGLSLGFGRSYNNRSDDNVGLGPGWTHSFAWSMELTSTDLGPLLNELGEDSNQWAIVHTGDGAAVNFRDAGTNTTTWIAPPWSNWQLEDDGDAGYKLTVDFGAHYLFDSNGVLTNIADTVANAIDLTYSNSYPDHLLTEIAHSSGQSLQLLYNASNLISRIDSPSTNFYVTFEYDASSNLTTAVRNASLAGAATATYTYDAAGNITQRLDPAGHTFAWAYDEEDRCITSLVDSVYYDALVDYSGLASNHMFSTVLADTGSSTVTTRYYQIDLGRNTADAPVIDSVENLSAETARTYHFDENGNVTNRIHSEADHYISTIQRFDAYHQPTNVVFCYNQNNEDSTSFLWHETYRGCLLQTTDAEGRQTAYEYDYTNALLSAAKLVVSTTETYDTTFTYTDIGLPATVVNPNGVQIQYAYDASGFLTNMTPPAGTAVTYCNDVFGWLTNAVRFDEDDERSTVYERDELGRVLSATYISGTNDGATQLTETFLYDANGNITNHVDTGGRTTAYTYAPLGNLSSVIRQLDAASITNSFEYDKQMNTLAITDAEGRSVEQYVLDAQYRPVSITNLEGQAMTIAYAVENYVAAVQRFDNTVVTNQYDAGGRLAGVSYLSGTNELETLTFSHYKNGLLASAENDTGLITNVYNSVNRLTATTNPVPNGAIEYTYYPAGQVSNVTSAAGETTYTLDSADRVDQIDSPAGSFDFSYHTNGCNNGLLAEVAASNGITASYWCDAFGRIQSIAWHDSDTNTLKSFHYEYNTAGMITNIDYESGEFVTFTYDDLDRLTGETHYTAAEEEIWDQTYSYDNVGNRLQKTSDDLTIAYTLEAGNNRLSGWTMATNLSGYVDVVGYADEDVGTNWRFGELWISNSVAVTPSTDGSNFWYYDLQTPLGTQDVVCAIRDMAGNMTYVTNQFLLTAVTNAAYAYDLAGCTTNISYAGVEYSANIDLSWDARYQLESVSLDGAEIEAYQYDALGRRTSVSNETGVTYFVHDGVHVAAEVDAAGTVTRSYTHGPGIDNLLAMTVHGDGGTNTNYYFITDHLGTVHAVTDESGNIVEEYRFDAWGRVLGVYDGDGQPLEESAIGNHYLFQGRWYSWEAGFYFFRARWYDPVTGRWLSKDRIGIAGGLNQYAFCANNPVNFRDPFGLCQTPEDRYSERQQLIQKTREYINQNWPWGTRTLGGLLLDVGLIGTDTAYQGERSGLSPETSMNLGTAQGVAITVTGEALLDATIFTGVEGLADLLLDDCIDRVERHGPPPKFKRHAHGRTKSNKPWSINDDGTAHDGNYQRIPKKDAQELTRRGFIVPPDRYPLPPQ